MKHLRVVTKQAPASAFWFRWYLQIAKSGTLTNFVNVLFGSNDDLDIRDV